MKETADDFRAWMDDRRLKAADVCEALQVTEQTIHNWRSDGVPDRRKPHVETFMRNWTDPAIKPAESAPPTLADYFPPGSSIVLTPGEKRLDRWTEAFKKSDYRTFREWAECGLDDLADKDIKNNTHEGNGTDG